MRRGAKAAVLERRRGTGSAEPTPAKPRNRAGDTARGPARGVARRLGGSRAHAGPCRAQRVQDAAPGPCGGGHQAGSRPRHHPGLGLPALRPRLALQGGNGPAHGCVPAAGSPGTAGPSRSDGRGSRPPAHAAPVRRAGCRLAAGGRAAARSRRLPGIPPRRRLCRRRSGGRAGRSRLPGHRRGSLPGSLPGAVPARAGR